MDEELKSLIRQYIREALEEIFIGHRSSEQKRDEYPRRFERRLVGNHLELQVNRLAFLITKLESWASSSTCRYDKNEISDIKTLVESIDGKVP